MSLKPLVWWSPSPELACQAPAGGQVIPGTMLLWPYPDRHSWTGLLFCRPSDLRGQKQQKAVASTDWICRCVHSCSMWLGTCHRTTVTVEFAGESGLESHHLRPASIHSFSLLLLYWIEPSCIIACESSQQTSACQSPRA